MSLVEEFSLPPESIAAYFKLQREVSRDPSRVYSMSGGYDTRYIADTQAAAREVPKEELAEFELRHSIRSRSLAHEMRYFQPNEKEFRAIFTAKGSGGPVALPTLTDESRQDDFALVFGIHSMSVGLKSALGPDRFKAYLRTEQPAYRKMTRVVEQLKLPPEALEASMTVIIEAETRTMRQGDRLPPGDSYAREIRERLEKVLGPGGVEQALEVYPIPYLLNP